LEGLAATENVTEPLPLPINPDVIVIQESLLAAVHAHPLAAETLTAGAAPPPGLAA
jgi:hypothetical protein